MQRLSPALVAMCLACAVPALRGVEPIPESEQAARALKVIEAYHAPRPAQPPRTLHIVYYTPAGREPEPRYRERLEPILEDIRAFYRDDMEQSGFGPRTFPLERDASGKLVIYLVKGKQPETAFARWEGRNGGNTGDPSSGPKVVAECRPTLDAAGISLDRETVLIFCNLAAWDAKASTFRHHSPYFGSSDQTSGLCFALDSVIQDVADITRKEPMLKDAEWGRESLGKFNTVFIGGTAHELGHAFSLPHCGERWDEKARGTSLMGSGNHNYREERRGEGKGAFLTMASAMRLAARPLFNGSAKGEADAGRLQACELSLSTNVTGRRLLGRRGALRLEGTVRGSPALYGVIAYFDSAHDGGYQAPTATSVPDSQGKFALEVSDLAPCADVELRVEFCHANGAVSTRRLEFTVAADGHVDLSRWELRHALEPVAEAVAQDQLRTAQAALQELEARPTPESTQDIARKLVATLDEGTKPNPADAPAGVTQLPLGDAQPKVAEVGWLKPAANRIPPNEQIESPLLDSGKLYATGLYAHSPSRYVYELGGRWKTLRGEAGLHTAHQPYAVGVVFVIKADGRQAFRSAAIRGAAKASYEVDVTGVKTLELLVENAGDSNHNNWALWLNPTLVRGP